MLLAVSLAIVGAGTALAANPSSSHYQLSESQFNASSLQETCSDQYCSRASIGGLTSGETKNSTSTATFGPITPEEPSLDVIVDPGESSLGVLDSSHTASKTMVVRVRNYLSKGYVLQIIGDPPKYGTHALATPTTPTPSTIGTEQFAINAAINTTPAIGADPVQVPSGQFSFGVVNADYDTPNQFKYVSEDVVAHSLTSSGRTDYTISMIVNISNTTPAGHYSGDYSAVVIPVY